MTDDCGRVFNVEVQTSDKKNLPKRMRYYQGVIDVELLSPGANYNDLGQCFVLFICNYDPFDRERYIYTFENRCVEESDLPFGDETVKVIANTRGTVGEISEELKELFLYFDKGIATGAYTRQLDDAVKSVKASEERRHEYMVMMIRKMEARAEALEEGRAEGRQEGREEGALEERQRVAIDMLKENGMSISFIAKISRLSEDAVLDLARESGIAVV